MENKFFVWYDSDTGYGRGGIMYGPHDYQDNKNFERRLYHQLEELLEMNGISDSIKKRLSGAKIGTILKVQYLHSSGNLMLKRIDESEVKILDEVTKCNEQIDILNKRSWELHNQKEALANKIGLKIK